MKTREKINPTKATEKVVEGFRDRGVTSCPAGSFETAAALDAQAALIKNRSWISGVPGLKTWDSDYAAAPERITGFTGE